MKASTVVDCHYAAEVNEFCYIANVTRAAVERDVEILRGMMNPKPYRVEYYEFADSKEAVRHYREWKTRQGHT